MVRRGVARWAAGRPVSAVEVLDERSTRRQPGGVTTFEAGLIGRRLGAPARRGKYLWVPLGGPQGEAPTEQALVVHLGMSGQLLVGALEDPAQRHLRIRILLEEGGSSSAGTPGADTPLELRFVDQRIFGGLFLDSLVPSADRPDQLLPATVAHIARDPLDPYFDPAAVHARLSARKTGLKRALLDQSLVSGIGNIYADEALWRAQLHYARPTETLNRGETARLLAAAQDVMEDALSQGGTSFDSLYVNVNGESGYFSRELKVYGRSGQPCERCGTPIVREKFMNRSSHLCPVCQQSR